MTSTHHTSVRLRNYDQINFGLLNEIISFQEELIGAALDLSAMMELVGNRVASWLEADGVAVELVDIDEFAIHSAIGVCKALQGSRNEWKDFLNYCLDTAQIIRCDNSYLEARIDPEFIRKTGVRSLMVAPLIYRGARIGVIKVASLVDNHFVESDEHILELTAGFFASAFSNARQTSWITTQAGYVGVWDYDIKSQRLTWSDSLKALWGYHAGDRASDLESMLSRIHPNDIAAFTYALNSCSDTHREFELEMRVLKPDGSTRWVYVTARCLYDIHRAPTRMAGAMMDITDRKRMETELKQSEQRLKLALEAGQLGSWTLDLQTLQLECTDVFKSNFGIAPDAELTYPQLVQLIHPHDREFMEASVRHAIETGSQYHAEYRVIWPDESEHWIRANGIVEKNHQKVPLRINGITANVTEEKLAKASLERAKDSAEAANRMKSSFIANMSHEIRTPLGAILGFGRLLQEPGINDSDFKNFADVIVRNGDQLHAIINDVLDFSKIEAGYLKTDLGHVQLRGIITEVMSLLSVKANERGLRLTCVVDPDAPNSIISDPIRIRQILTNIVGNAIKFTQQGFVRIKLCKSSEPQYDAFIDVTDSGIGISREVADRLFQSFVQGDNAMSATEGTGLGLALSKRLARLLDGDVILAGSEPGCGSTFRIKIKHHAELENQIAETARSMNSPSTSIRLDGLRVLLVEDSPDGQELVRRILNRRGVQVDVAGNGIDGVEKALRNHFDMVLMDVQMPILDGYGATKRLRHLGYRKPIIALTAHAMVEARQATLNAGFTDFLTKPIIFSELLEKVAKYGKVTAEV